MAEAWWRFKEQQIWKYPCWDDFHIQWRWETPKGQHANSSFRKRFCSHSLSFPWLNILRGHRPYGSFDIFACGFLVHIFSCLLFAFNWMNRQFISIESIFWWGVSVVQTTAKRWFKSRWYWPDLATHSTHTHAHKCVTAFLGRLNQVWLD